MSILLQFRAIYTHNSTKGLHPAPPKCRFYYSFARSTRTILRKGCTQHRQIAILLQFRAIDTYDLTKGFIQLRQDRNFTTVSRDRHVRSYERVHLQQVKNRQITTVSRDRHVRSYERVHRAGKKSSNYYSFVRSTRTILREGCISASIFRTMAAPPPQLLK